MKRKRVKLLKKIGGMVLSVALLVSMGVLVFITEDNSKITALAGDESSESKPDESKPDESKPGESKPDESKPDESKPEESKPSSSSGASSSSGSSGSASVATTKDPVQKTVEQKVSENISKDIAKAVSQAKAAGSEKAIVKIDGKQSGIHTLSRDTIKELSNANVDAEFAFDYNGYHYVITIPAGATPISDDIPWCGPMYLMSLYGNTAVVTPIE